MLGKTLVVVVVLAASTIPTATAQQSSKAGEVIVTSSGQLVPPWKEVKACIKEKCSVAIANPETHEVARYGDRWATKFEATGNGREVRRAEAEIDKARRLKGATPAQ